MKQYNSQIRYVEARPRKEKNRAKATASVVVAGSASSSVGGVSKSYVDSNFVTLATEQDIQGKKNFVGGLGVNGQYITYNAEKKYWELVGDLIVSGAITMFGSSAGFVPSTIMDGVQVDNDTIIINAAGQLQVIGGGGSGGTGGGLTAAEVNVLISNALKPYALSSSIPTDNKQLENGAGYITAAALNGLATEQYVTTRGYITSDALAGYATQNWVEGKKYLTGITSSQVTTALGFTPYDSTNPDKYIKGINYDMVIAALGYTPYSTTNPMGYLTTSSLLGYATEQWVGESYLAKSGGTISFGNSNSLLTVKSTGGTWSGIKYESATEGGYIGVHQGEPVYIPQDMSRIINIIHSNNIGSYNAGSATKLATARTIWGQSFDGTGNVYGSFYTTDSIFLNSGGEGIYISVNSISWHNSSNSWTNSLLGFIADGTVVAHNKLAIGGTTADAKLHVYGNARIEGDVKAGGATFSSNNSCNLILNSNAQSVTFATLQIDNVAKGYVGYSKDGVFLQNGTASWAYITVSDEGKFVTSCDATINGNLLATGAITMFSQLSMKNVIDYDGLSLAQLAQIKPARFTWKDGRDSLVHAGGIADEVMQVLPEVIYQTSDDKLTMDYGSAAFYIGTSLIKPVIDHEKRIAELEREVEYLREENRQLRAS